MNDRTTPVDATNRGLNVFDVVLILIVSAVVLLVIGWTLLFLVALGWDGLSDCLIWNGHVLTGWLIATAGVFVLSGAMARQKRVWLVVPVPFGLVLGVVMFGVCGLTHA